MSLYVKKIGKKVSTAYMDYVRSSGKSNNKYPIAWQLSQLNSCSCGSTNLVHPEAPGGTPTTVNERDQVIT
jgi:hypothetical protein